MSRAGALLVSVRQLSVRYGATAALDGVDLEVHAGEIHAVVGENGAGKSTLLGAIAGAVRPTRGTIVCDAAAWVPQDPALPADLTAAEWIFLGRERRRFRLLRRAQMRDESAAALRRIGCACEPRARLGALSPVQAKQVQLARAFTGAPQLLLLDEPTAVLGDAEAQQLFAAIRDLRAAGSGVVYVSHRIDEVLSLADRVTVLRDGRVTAAAPVAALDTAAVVRHMVGRDLEPQRRRDHPPGAMMLELDGVDSAALRDITLSLRQGEIVGLAGLIGAGRSELLEVVTGLRPRRRGRLRCAAPPHLVPEDRKRKGLVPALRLRENLCLPASGWLLHPRQERAVARDWIARLRLRSSGSEAPVQSLSGGNQQKLLLARVLRHAPRLLLLDEPTAGVDVAAKAEIHRVIGDLAEGGAAILMASSELPELLALCDRIVALRAGRIVGELAREQATEMELAALITGATRAA